MNGQWTGWFSGTNNGKIIVNTDDMGDHYAGYAYFFDELPNLPNLAVFFKTENQARSLELKVTEIYPINPQSGLVDIWEKCKSLFPEGMIIPKNVDVNIKWDEKQVELSWITDIGTNSTCILPKTKAAEPSELESEKIDWNGFKKQISGLKGKKYLYRGQNKPWRLRTTFHRTGRANLNRYVTEDIPELHRNLSARTEHLFDLEKPQETGAFYNLLQHHGYPTPLLDWTLSPYVAIFFAYRGIEKKHAEMADANDHVRVFLFDHAQWEKDLEQIHHIYVAASHLSAIRFIAIENERSVPQQSFSTFTNLDDIETYIKSRETDGKKYLTAFDLPIRERNEIMLELSFMGITAGSLFPGIDGTCEAIRELYF